MLYSVIYWSQGFHSSVPCCQMYICHITQEKALKVAARGTSCELFFHTYMFTQSSGSTHRVTQTYTVVTHTRACFRLLWNCEVSCNRVVLLWDSCWPQVKHMVYCYALILVGIWNDWAYDRSWLNNWCLCYNTFLKNKNMLQSRAILSGQIMIQLMWSCDSTGHMKCNLAKLC